MTVLQGYSHHGCGTMAVFGGAAAGCCKAATGHGERRATTASTTAEVPRGCGDASVFVAMLGAELRSKGGHRCYDDPLVAALLRGRPERWPWPPDARAPPAKDPQASRPSPCNPHLAGDLNQVPSSARANLHPPAPQLCSPSASVASCPKQRRGAPCHEPLQHGKPGRPRLLLAS